MNFYIDNNMTGLGKQRGENKNAAQIEVIL
jgi:hypothetical protein